MKRHRMRRLSRRETLTFPQTRWKRWFRWLADPDEVHASFNGPGHYRYGATSVAAAWGWMNGNPFIFVTVTLKITQKTNLNDVYKAQSYALRSANQCHNNKSRAYKWNECEKKLNKKASTSQHCTGMKSSISFNFVAITFIRFNKLCDSTRHISHTFRNERHFMRM